MKKYMTIEEFFKTQNEKTEKNNRRKGILIVIPILCLSIIIFSLYTILNWFQDNSKIRQLSTEIEEKIEITEKKEEGELVNPPKSRANNYYYYAMFPFYEVNLSILEQQNNDTVAFLHIPNTKINYPVVKTTDNEFYLTHSFDKEDNKAGWIFMDYRNSLEPLSDNTILYGHRRLDGALFGSLKELLSPSWQEEKSNYVISFSTKKESMLFQIFSIYTIQEENYYITPNFSSKNKKAKWLYTMKARNTAPIDTDVDINDKILTLSTCQNNQGGRIVVQAKLIKRKYK